MTDTRERFLGEIAGQLPPERIEELHLFPPIRQGGIESGVAVVAAEPEVADGTRPRRHTVYTARYRHTLKGPERGKWEFDLVAEADAPLITVETVVRGVQKRSGELADPERLGPDDLRSAMDDTPWRATTT